MVLALVVVRADAWAQDGRKRQKDGGWERFEEVDPYTEGLREKLDRLGYVRYGPFTWREGVSTEEVRQTMGGMDVLFVETPHFKIASTLATYVVTNDRGERSRIAASQERLESKLGRLKVPRRELDPWLRLHLYAQCLEETFARFVADFRLGDVPLAAGEVFPGQKEKVRVVLCERHSEFQRVLGQETGVAADEYYWGINADSALFLAANAEHIRTRWMHADLQAVDTQLNGHVLSGTVASLLGGYRDNYYGVPAWFLYGLMHYYSRDVDPRWTTAAGQSPTKEEHQEDAEWFRRVAGLLEVDFFASVDDMFRWIAYADLDERAHLIAWSRVEFLMQREGADRRAFLDALAKRPAEGSAQEIGAELVRRSTEALKAGFDLDPATFEEEWKEHVRRTYARRK